MSDLLKLILEVVLGINELENYKATFRYMGIELAVDVLKNGENVYHADTTDYNSENHEGAIMTMLADLTHLLAHNHLKVKTYTVDFADDHIRIQQDAETHAEAVNTANQLNEKYNIECTISEVYQ
jgi:hypothetical protein